MAVTERPVAVLPYKVSYASSMEFLCFVPLMDARFLEVLLLLSWYVGVRLAWLTFDLVLIGMKIGIVLIEKSE